MDDRLQYGKALRGDIATLAEFRVAMFKDMFPDEDWHAKAKDLTEASIDYYERRIESTDEYACIARIEGKSVGSGSIMFQERAPHFLRLRNLCGYILSIYVLPDHRGRGIASGIVETLLAEARRRGAFRVGLHASKAGRGVYERMGFAAKESYLEMEL